MTHIVWYILTAIAGIAVGVLLYHIIYRRHYKRFPEVKLSHSVGFIPTKWKDTESGEREISKMTLTHISTSPDEEDG